MSTTIQDIESSQLRTDLPDFAPGDRVRVHFLVIEGNRKRPQVFEGVVIKRQGSGARETFTVRKQSFGVGVERTFPIHSHKIEKLEVASRGRVRRAKLYYLRGRTGKAARVAERRWGIDDDVVAAGSTGAVDASGEGLAPEEFPEEETALGTDEAEAEGSETAADEAADAGTGADSPETPEAEASDTDGDSEPGEDGEEDGTSDGENETEQQEDAPPESGDGSDAGSESDQDETDGDSGEDGEEA